MTESIEYVVGFVFSQDLQQVCLLRKTHPDWMAGKMNGVGGLRKLGEDSGESMAREAQEETGLVSKNYDWIHFARLECRSLAMQGFALSCFAIRADLTKLTSPTEEKIEIWPVTAIWPARADLVQHVDWMVPMALSQMLANYTMKLEGFSDPRA